MKEDIKIVYEGGQDEIVEKKSRFIGMVFPVDSEEDAVDIIDKCKKKYWDARHCCYAYIIGDNMELQRFSDDGEPQGTAGKPILDVLLNSGVHNCIIIVIRYFGGTLLGTGGLVRAYSQAAKAALEKSEIIDKIKGFVLNIKTDYHSIGKIQYLLFDKDIVVWKSDYTDVVSLNVLVSAQEIDEVVEEITEATSGKSEMEIDREIYFAVCAQDINVYEIEK